MSRVSTKQPRSLIRAGPPHTINNHVTPLAYGPSTVVWTGYVTTYQIKYKGGVSSSGIVSKESFHFEKVRGGTSHFTDIIFGCGHDNKNVSFKGRETSGIVGLNGFRHSLVQQLFSSIQGRLSYCLISGMNKSSLLNFGEDAVIPPGPEIRTLRFVNQNFSHYGL